MKAPPATNGCRRRIFITNVFLFDRITSVEGFKREIGRRRPARRIIRFVAQRDQFIAQSRIFIRVFLEAVTACGVVAFVCSFRKANFFDSFGERNGRNGDGASRCSDAGH